MDSTCSSPASAALLRGCATSISSFANLHIDGIFTVLFGIVGESKLTFLAQLHAKTSQVTNIPYRYRCYLYLVHRMSAQGSQRARTLPTYR